MNLTAVNRTLALLGGMFDPNRLTEPFLPQMSGKPVFQAGNPTLPRISPESVGVSSEHIAAFLHRLRENPQFRMHSVMILRHGNVICDADFGGQDHRYPRYTFSACKSIVSIAVGILCDQGKLHTDDKIIDLFSDRITPVARLRLAPLTVEHLLTMRSAIMFNELESQTDEDWIKCFLNSATSGEIGGQFQYNSLNTYLLSAIVIRKSGMSLSAFLQKYLFDAMDIRDFYWECCPRGIEIGGWGLYMRPEDLAKIGLLLLNGGNWNGKQLISKDYLTRALSPIVKTPPTTGRYDYGYQFWVGTEPRAYLCNGLFGQNILAFPDTDMLIVSTASNDELFQQGPFYDLATDFFGDPAKLSDKALAPSAAGDAKLRLALLLCRDHTAAEIRAVEADIRTAEHPVSAEQKSDNSRSFLTRVSQMLFGQSSAQPQRESRPTNIPERKSDDAHLPPSAALFLNSTFVPQEQEPSVSVGLFPAVMQTVHSNFTRGFVSVSFSRILENGEERLLVTYREADDTHIFSAGIHRAAQTQLYFHGTPFLAAAKVSFPTDEDGRQVCKIHIDFPEIPSCRIIKLFLNADGTALLRQEETPGAGLLTSTVIGWKTNLSQSVQPVLGGALEKIDNDYLSYRIRRTLSPELKLRRVSME